ncbi:NAD-P-binding protein [Pilatotrama ljubarskyi]|nr:NAD-P-binding protein [Pilatotrama ljubarskyi]
MATASYSVAIVGGTGGLGQRISLVFLTEFKANFHTVRVLTRDPSSATAQELSGQGAQLHKLDESNLPRALDDAFAGVDVIVNALTSGVPDELKQGVIDAAARSSANVYFLSEFGSDHRVNDFPGYEHPEWIRKQEIAAETRAKLQGKKVIAPYTSVFLEYAISPFLGIDVKNNVYTCYGSPSQRFTATDRRDIGRSVARLAILALDPATAHKVLDELRIAGSTVSYEEVRDIVARVKGVPKGEIKSEDLAQLKGRIRQDPGKSFIEMSTAPFSVVLGEGKADFSSDNANGLVNPGEAFWKWKTVEDYIREL